MITRRAHPIFARTHISWDMGAGRANVPFLILRFAAIVWISGFILLAAIATSSYLFSGEEQPSRGARWMSRLRMSLIWPIAMLSASGRARLRVG